MVPLGDDLTRAVRGALNPVAAAAGRVSTVARVGAGNTDANGDATFTIGGWQAGAYAAWNLYLTADGGGSFPVSLEQTSTPVGGALATNGIAIGGPFLTWGTDVLTVTITGGPANSPVRVICRGIQSAELSDVAGFPGPSFSSAGAFQADPAQLLTGQVGPPLIENATEVIPATPGTLTLPAAGQFYNVSGYAGILFKAVVSGGGNFPYADLIWADSSGNTIGTTRLGSLGPRIVAPVAAQGLQLQIVLRNSDVAAHTLANLTVVPLATLPSRPDQLLDTDLTSVGDGRAIISTQISVPAGTSQTVFGKFVWPGRAVLTIDAGSGNQNVQVTCTDALGHVTTVGSEGALSYPPPVDVQLASGLPAITYNNTGTGTQVSTIALIASS